MNRHTLLPALGPRTLSPTQHPRRAADLAPASAGWDRAVAVSAPSSAARPSLLQHYLTELREHADPNLVPTNVARRRHPGLSQGQVARAIGVSVGYYGRLEAGKARWRVEWLESVARLFALTANQRATLYRLALGWAPAETTAPSSSEPHALIDNVPFVAMLLSPLTEVEYCNTYATEYLRVEAGSSLTKTVLLDRDVRPRLHDWGQGWALPAINRLRTLSRRAPEQYQPGIDALITEVLDNAEVRALWNQHRDAPIEPTIPLRQLVTDCGVCTAFCVWQQLDGHPYSRILFAIPADQLTTPDIG